MYPNSTAGTAAVEKGALLEHLLFVNRKMAPILPKGTFFGRLDHMASGILAPRPGIELASPELEAWSLKHWTSREIPEMCIFSIAMQPAFWMWVRCVRLERQNWIGDYFPPCWLLLVSKPVMTSLWWCSIILCVERKPQWQDGLHACSPYPWSEWNEQAAIFSW